MGLFKKKTPQEPVVPVTEVHDDSTGTAADVEAVMEKIRPGVQHPGLGGSAQDRHQYPDGRLLPYCIIDTVFLATLTEIRLPVFVGMICCWAI